MPDAAGNLTPAEIGAQISGFFAPPGGVSPLTQAAIQAFQQQTLPTIQQQFQLMGLGHSPALGVATGSALTQALVPFLQGDLENRLAALRLAQQGLDLSQTGATRAAQIAQIQQQMMLDPVRLAGSLVSGLAQPFGTAANLGLQRQQLALEAFGAAGQAQQGVAQSALDQQMADLLRRQALSESSSTGLFGSSVLPPTLQQIARTRTSGK